ncbi:MAG: hypothetical protein WCG19_06805 [Chlorobiaceae bacterium]
MANGERDQLFENTPVTIKKLDAVGWGLFFIWMGIAVLAGVGWGVGLLGVGVIMLGGQVARRYFGLPYDRFGLVIGILFVLGGVSKVLNIELRQAAIPGGLLPILLILVGTVIVASALLRNPKS